MWQRQLGRDRREARMSRNKETREEYVQRLIHDDMARRNEDLKITIDRCGQMLMQHDYNGFAYLQTAMLLAASQLKEAAVVDEYWEGVFNFRKGLLSSELRRIIKSAKVAIRNLEAFMAQTGGAESWDVPERDARTLRKIQDEAASSNERWAARIAEERFGSKTLITHNSYREALAYVKKTKSFARWDDGDGWTGEAYYCRARRRVVQVSIKPEGTRAA